MEQETITEQTIREANQSALMRASIEIAGQYAMHLYDSNWDTFEIITRINRLATLHAQLD